MALISQSSSLLIATNIFAAIFIGFGINAIVRPESEIEFFEFQCMASKADKNLIDGLMVAFGVRGIFIGVAIYCAAFFENRKSVTSSGSRSSMALSVEYIQEGESGITGVAHHC